MKSGLYVPDSLLGDENPSHYFLNVYALNKNRHSSMKNHLLATKPPEFFESLEQNLREDISNHYLNAHNQGCNDIIWSNEGLYLLNSTEEYTRLLELFKQRSSEVVCLCCFREFKSYRKSYMRQLKKHGQKYSNDKDSHRYTGKDSWLFDYEKKVDLLEQVFDKVIVFPYTPDNMVKTFMEKIDYPADENLSGSYRLNVTESSSGISRFIKKFMR